MNELLLALAIICTKTNDLNRGPTYITNFKKACVAEILKCINLNKKSSELEKYSDCLTQSVVPGATKDD